MKSRVLARDLENISKRVCFQEFDNSTVLVTGVTGLIGSLLVKTLIFCSRKYKLNVKVVACVRSVEKADRIFVIDNGGICEQGTAAELMERKGAYYKLYMAQFAGV